MSPLASFFDSVQLPALSKVAHALIKTLNDENASFIELRSILAQDPALCAKLLRVANSAQFGLPRGVATLDDAIAMVGLAKVRSLSLAACLNNSFPDLAGLSQQAFWAHCMTCAGYAQWLAQSLDMDSQQAWLSGMMLRLGELLICQSEPGLLLEIEQTPLQPGDRWTQEKRLAGFSEGQITAELARRWNFPMQIVQGLQRACDPMTEQAFSRLGAVLHLSGLLADTPQAGPEVLDTLPPAVLTALNLDVPWLHSHFPEPDTFVKMSDF